MPCVASADAPVDTAPGERDATEAAAQGNWGGGLDSAALADGSSLVTYFGETAARGGAEARFRIGFSPRFGCAPAIDLVLDEALAATLARAGDVDEPGELPVAANGSTLPGDPGDAGEPSGAGLRDDDEAAFMIDGAPVGFRAIVDARDGTVELAYNGNERQRMTLRLQVDVGDFATFGVAPAGPPIVFSLLGSRRTLATAESGCLVHEPAALPQ